MIALVVTIIVLLILAGVTITAVLGEDGIIEKAKEAKRQTEEAIEAQDKDMADLLNEIEGIMGGETPDPTPPTPSEPADEPEKLSSLAQAATNGTVLDTNQNLEDEYGNKVVVPAGFKVLKNGESNVEYKYSTEHPGTPTVQDGVVIEDVSTGDEGSEGNQFVWIPVGSINNKEGESTTITLGRYTTFADNEQPKTDGSKITVSKEFIGNIDYTEDTKTESGKGNTIAKDIDLFKSSANTNGGYYLARYEASYGGENKPLSKPSTGIQATSNGASYAPSTDSQKGQLWNNITQPDASTAAQNMYNSESFTSDLTNSYAWDTAIVFIQKYSENNQYSKETSKNHNSSTDSPDNTGERTNNAQTDKVCNIYDMASNCLEWTTETCSANKNPCVLRGGSYGDLSEGSIYRGWGMVSAAYRSYSFRAVLYVK